MDIGVISVRYARALLKRAYDIQEEDQVYAEMQMLARNYSEHPELRSAIDNPMCANDKKEQLLLTACGMPGDLSRRFIRLVLAGGREDLLQLMAISYITLYRQEKNIIKGTLTTATPVSSETEKKMKNMVTARTNGVVEFQTKVDPDIIGGFILEYDTYRMDASVKSKLNSILAQLKK